MTKLLVLNEKKYGLEEPPMTTCIHPLFPELPPLSKKKVDIGYFAGRLLTLDHIVL